MKTNNENDKATVKTTIWKQKPDSPACPCALDCIKSGLDHMLHYKVKCILTITKEHFYCTFNPSTGYIHKLITINL